jgi:predicted nucleotidyltransferase
MFSLNLPILIKPFEKDLAIILQKYLLAKLFVFGSILTEKFDNLKSDIDFLVEFDETNLKPEDIGDLCLNLSNDLEQLFKRKVDVLRNRPFRNYYFEQSLNRTKLLIYDRKRTEIPA